MIADWWDLHITRLHSQSILHLKGQHGKPQIERWICSLIVESVWSYWNWYYTLSHHSAHNEFNGFREFCKKKQKNPNILHTGNVTEALTFPKSKYHMCYTKQAWYFVFQFHVCSRGTPLNLCIHLLVELHRNDVCNYGDARCHEDGDS